MAGFSSVFGTAPAAPATSEGAFASVFGSGGPANVATTRQSLSAQVETSEAQAKNANSPLSIAEGTVEDIGSRLYNAGSDAVSGLFKTYGTVIPQAVSQVQSGAADIQKGLSEPTPTIGGAESVLKGAGKAVLGTAGGAAGAIFAPIGAAIGAALEATGGQALFDDAGQKIADVGGITDWPAFQKFAMAHPNAGTYFNQTLNLALAGGDKSDILDSSKKAAQVIIDSAKQPIRDSEGKTITPNPITKLPVHGDTTLRPLPVAGESVEQRVPIANDYRTGADIQAGPKAASDLPTIQAGEPTPSAKMGEYTVEPIQQPTAPAVAPDVAKTPTAPVVENAPTAATVNPSSEMPTKVANDISDALVKQGMAELTPEQKSTYTSGSYKDSAAQAEIIKEQDPEALKRMAVTGKGIPEGVHPQIVFNIVDKLAADTKNYKLQQELAKSPLGTERSVHAQQLGSSGFNKVSESPVDVIRKAAEKKAGGEKGTKEVAAEAKKAKSTITKAAAKMMDYQSIIDAIKTC